MKIDITSPPPEVTKVTLTLRPHEMIALRALLDLVGGSSDGPRGMFEILSQGLYSHIPTGFKTFVGIAKGGVTVDNDWVSIHNRLKETPRTNSST